MSTYPHIILIALMFSALIPSLVTFIVPPILLEVDCGNQTYILFVDVLYPHGFKNIYRTIVRGHATIYIDVGDVKRAWDTELSLGRRYSRLTLRVVAYNESGLVGVEVKSIDFDRILLDNIVTINFSKTQSPQAMLLKYPITPKIFAARVLEDSYEWNASVVFTLLRMDNTSFGALFYSYNGVLGMGSTIYLVVPNVKLIGWVSYSGGGSISKHVFLRTGETGYVWMTFKYRWEKWRVYGPNLSPGGYEEQYIYIANFYPETTGIGRSKPSNAILTHIDGWSIQLYKANHSTQPYFHADYGYLGKRYNAIDLVSFADVLVARGKITQSIRDLIAETIPVIGVDSCNNKFRSGSYVIHVVVYSAKVPLQHIVNIGKANVHVGEFDSFPVLYIVIREK